MKVFAFDSQRTIVPVDLPPAVVSDREINPWLVDLLDPDPVELKVGEKSLLFTRLRALSFCQVDGNQITIGLRDENGQQTCSTGSTAVGPLRWAPNGLWLPTAQDRDFDSHWNNCLTRLQSKDGSAGVVTLIPLKPDRQPRLKDRTLYWGQAGMSLKAGFTGEMFNEVQIPYAFPEPYNWIFEHFGHLQPVITGSALRRLIWGKPVKHIHIFVLSPDHANLVSSLAQLGGHFHADNRTTSAGKSGNNWPHLAQAHLGNGAPIAIDRVGIIYHFFSASPGYLININHTVTRWHYGNTLIHWTLRGYPPHLWGSSWVADCLLADRPNAISAPRIALRDLGLRRLRKLSLEGEVTS